jgi:hypothetical protein
LIWDGSGYSQKQSAFSIVEFNIRPISCKLEFATRIAEQHSFTAGRIITRGAPRSPPPRCYILSILSQGVENLLLT